MLPLRVPFKSSLCKNENPFLKMMFNAEHKSMGLSWGPIIIIFVRKDWQASLFNP